MVINFTGYHGTLWDDGSNILKTKHYKLSTKDDEWLGIGIYFFEESRHAVEWCINQKCDCNNKHYMVIKSAIECDDKNIIDMTKEENRELYFQIMERIKLSMQKFISNRKIKGDGFVFNHIYEKIRKFDLVRALFFCQDNYYNQNRNFTRLMDLQYQICVRNRECIKSIELHKDGSVS